MQLTEISPEAINAAREILLGQVGSDQGIHEIIDRHMREHSARLQLNLNQYGAWKKAAIRQLVDTDIRIEDLVKENEVLMTKKELAKKKLQDLVNKGYIFLLDENTYREAFMEALKDCQDYIKADPSYFRPKLSWWAKIASKIPWVKMS